MTRLVSFYKVWWRRKVAHRTTLVWTKLIRTSVSKMLSSSNRLGPRILNACHSSIRSSSSSWKPTRSKPWAPRPDSRPVPPPITWVAYCKLRANRDNYRMWRQECLILRIIKRAIQSCLIPRSVTPRSSRLLTDKSRSLPRIDPRKTASDYLRFLVWDDIDSYFCERVSQPTLWLLDFIVKTGTIAYLLIITAIQILVESPQGNDVIAGKARMM